MPGDTEAKSRCHYFMKKVANGHGRGSVKGFTSLALLAQVWEEKQFLVSNALSRKGHQSLGRILSQPLNIRPSTSLYIKTEAQRENKEAENTHEEIA
jgi:hypothetical protein